MSEITPIIGKSTLNLGYISEVLRRSQTDFSIISSRNTFDLADLCTHANINMWSKRKPFRHAKMFFAEDGDNTKNDRTTAIVAQNYGLSLPSYVSGDSTCLLRLAQDVVQNSAANSAWSFLRPRGVPSEPYRIADFIGYRHTTPWSEGEQPAMPQLFDLPLFLTLEAGNADGLMNGTILRMTFQDVDGDTSGVLTATDIMACKMSNGRLISEMYVGVMLVEKKTAVTGSDITVWLTKTRVSSIAADDPSQAAEYPYCTIKGLTDNAATAIHYILIPFLYYGLEYDAAYTDNATHPFSAVQKIPSASGDAVVTMLGNKTMLRNAIQQMPTGITASASVSGSSTILTLTFQTGTLYAKYSRFVIVLLSDYNYSYGAAGEESVASPYDEALDTFMKSGIAGVGGMNVGIYAGCGAVSVQQQVGNSTTAGTARDTNPSAVKVSGNNWTFGYASDITQAIGTLNSSGTYTLALTIGRTSDSGGALNNLIMFYEKDNGDRMAEDLTELQSSGSGDATPSIAVDLQDQWQPSSVAVNGYTIYESCSNYNVGSGIATIKLKIKNKPNFKLYINSYAESNYDYTIAWDLDTLPAASPAYNSTGAKAHTRGAQKDPAAGISNFTEVDYANDGGTHTIYITYRKDSSVNANNDKGYIAIPNS